MVSAYSPIRVRFSSFKKIVSAVISSKLYSPSILYCLHKSMKSALAAQSFKSFAKSDIVVLALLTSEVSYIKRGEPSKLFCMAALDKLIEKSGINSYTRFLIFSVCVLSIPSNTSITYLRIVFQLSAAEQSESNPNNPEIKNEKEDRISVITKNAATITVPTIFNSFSLFSLSETAAAILAIAAALSAILSTSSRAKHFQPLFGKIKFYTEFFRTDTHKGSASDLRFN